MKTAIRFCVVASIAALAAAYASAAPDYTNSPELECIGNPNAAKWPSNTTARHVPDLFPYQGKLYTSGGNWGQNEHTGPCPIWAIDPYSGTWEKEWHAGTEAVYEFKEFSDGRLYLPSIDIYERDWENGVTEAESHEGSHFRREADGNWRNYETALGKGNITQWLIYGYQGYRVHNWDMAEYKGYMFICGYGISGSTNWGETAMFNATPSLTSALRGSGLRRFYSFLVFDDDIYNFTCQPASGSDFKSTAWEEWRWDDTQAEKQFVKQDASWDDVAPGVTRGMLDYFGGNNVWFWHPTKFGSRTLYILGHENYNIAPIAAFSAVNQNHHVKATKINLDDNEDGLDNDDEVRPFDMCVADGAVYLVAAKGNGTDTNVVNSVWKSTDGVNFTKLFTFAATRPASAICYYDGIFYFGMGANEYTKKAWGSLGEDISGRIYRLRLPQAPVKVNVNETSLSMGEGEKKTVKYRLASQPSTNMTLKVWGTGRNAYWAINKKTLTFTPQNWNVEQAVEFSVEDFGSGNYTNALVCGTGGADCDSAYTKLAVTGRPFTPPTDPGTITLYDTMTIGGTSGTVASGVHVLTDYVPKWNSIVRTKYKDNPGANATQFLFCSRKEWNSEVFAWAARIGNNQCDWYFNDAQHYSWDNVVANDEAFLEVRKGDATLTRLSDENRWYLTNDVPIATFDPQYRLALFQSYQNGSSYNNWNNSFRGDFHYLQIFEEENKTEVLKHHFVPCVVSNDVKVCDIADNYRLYDLTKTSSGTASIPSGARAIGLVRPEGAGLAPEPEPEPAIEYGQLDMSAFAKRMDVTFSGYSGTALADFPVLVKLSASIPGFSYADFQKTNGGDLRFADATGKLLPHEIDTWNSNGVSTVWVKVPSLAANGKVTACWGCANPPEVAAKDVWDADYVGVWHLGESALPMKESSATSVGFTESNGSGIGFASDGVVGKSVDFGASGNSRALIADDHDALDGFARCTFEAWTHVTAENRAAGSNVGLLSKRNSATSESSYYLYDTGTHTSFYVSSNGTSSAYQTVVPVPSGDWIHQAFTFDSTTSSDNVAGWTNGVRTIKLSKSVGAVNAGSAKLYLGNFGLSGNAIDARNFPGRVDEVRISKVARSAAWLKATHDTVADANFATYAVEGASSVENDPVLVVTVNAGVTNTLNAITNVTEATWITSVVKRGAGTLVASGMPSGFNGLITIEAGVWLGGASASDFGEEGTVIDVKDGASLTLVGANGACPVENALSGKTINLYGAKNASASGKIQIFGDGGATIAFGENVNINLKNADSVLYAKNSTWNVCNFKSGAVNLGEKTLTIQAGGQVQMGLAFSNGGTVYLNGTAFYVDGTGMCPSFSGTGVLQSDSPINMKQKIDASGWTLKTSHQLYGNINAQPTKTDNPGWDGPVEFSWNSVQVANYAGASAGTSNTVFNLKGAVSGSGTLRIGPGWVNLHSADNTYSGAVYVNGQAVGTGATILPGGGGIGLWNGAACFPNASSVTFTNTARLAFMDSTQCSVGTNIFFETKAGEEQSVTGGNNDVRPTFGRFTKSGAGTLVFGAPAAVGEGRILGGMLKVPFQAVEGPSIAEMTARHPQFAKLEFAAGTMLDVSDNIGFKVDNLVGSPTVTNTGVFGVMEKWTLTDASSVLTLKGENVTVNDQFAAGILAFAEGATFAIANEDAYSNAVASAGADGLVVARANWVMGNSTLINGMAVVIPQPTAGMKYRWAMSVSDDHQTLRLKFASAGGYAAWIAEKGITGNTALDYKTNGIENGVRYAFDIDPANGPTQIGTPIIQVVRDSSGNPVVETRELATGRDDVTFGILAAENLTDWTTLIPMEKFNDGFWKPTASKTSGYTYPAKMFFKYTVEVK